MITVEVAAASLLSSFVTAGLGYWVRTRAKNAEYKLRQKKFAHIHLLRLTDTIAADQIVRGMLKVITDHVPKEDANFDFIQKFSVKVAELLTESDPEVIAAQYAAYKPIVDSTLDSQEKLILSNAQVAELPEDSIFFYNRFVTAISRLKIGLQVIDQYAKDKQFKKINEDHIDALMQGYLTLIESAGVLRAALQKAAELSDAQATALLVRSFNAQKADTAAGMKNQEKLKAARRAEGAATKAAA